MIKNIFILLSLCIVIFSCSDSNDPIKEVEKPPVETTDPFITLKKSNVDFTNEGGSEAILIESNVTWTTKSSASWCTVSPVSGNKSTESIKIAADENETYDDRSCIVTIEGEGITKTITVNQGENLGLLITQDRYELSNEENTIEVEVKANVEFEVEIHNEWITQVETRDLTKTELSFNIAENDTYSNREGSITISQTDGSLSSTITVNQSQENAIILSDKEVEVSDRSQTLEVVLKTNVDFEIIIKDEGQNWVSYTPTRALREEIVSLNISTNNTDKVRSTEVYIKDNDSNLQETLTIKQIGSEPGVYYVEKMGALGTMLNQTQKDTITTMIVKGEINKADFDVMKLEMPQLKYIDLKEVKCEGDKIPYRAFGGGYPERDNNTIINTIILPESITTIERESFQYCSGLTGNLVIPDGVTTIGSGAFSGCSGLTGDLIFPDEVITIGSHAFTSCTGFTDNLVLPEGLKTIEMYAFYLCSGFTGNLIIPDGIKVIEPYAFYNCSSFTGNLIIPDGVTAIKRSAFDGCSGLGGSLILPDELSKIGETAFSRCSGFTGDLIIPDKVAAIGERAFYYCTGFRGLTIGENLTTIYEEAFRGCSNITGNVIFTESLTSIRVSGFERCYNINSFKFPHTTPLSYFSNMIEKSVPVKVPNEAVSAYQSANGWREHTIIGY